MQHLRELLEDLKRGVSDLSEVIELKEKADSLGTTISGHEKQLEKLRADTADQKATSAALAKKIAKQRATLEFELAEMPAKLAEERAEQSKKHQAALRAEAQALEAARMQHRREIEEHQQWLDKAAQERAHLEHELVELRTAKRAMGR